MAGFRPLNTEEWMKSVESRFARLFRRIGGGRDTQYNEIVYDILPAVPDTVGGCYTIYNPGFGWEPTDNIFRVVLTAAGIVQMAGLFVAKAAIAAGGTILQLPPHLAPDFDTVFPCVKNGAASWLYVTAAGEVKVGPNMTAGQYVSLENVRYPATGFANWTDHVLQGGWQAYQPLVYGTPGYWVDGFGFTWQRGMICNGTTADNTVYATNDPLADPPAGESQHFISAHNGLAGGIGSLNGNAFVVKAGLTSSPTAWLSLAGALIATDAAYAHPDVRWVHGVLTSAWTQNTPASFTTLGFGQRSDGLVCMVGLFNPGNYNQTLCLVPGKMAPKNRRQMAYLTNNTFGYCEIQAQWDTTGGATYPASSFKFTTGSTWSSADGLTWFPDGF